MTGRIELKTYMTHIAEIVNFELNRSFPGEWPIPEPLHEAMLYSLNAGGKRLRPVLLIAAAEALGGAVETALPAACAIEMVHTYSLIHDDLPAMDDDDFRRGKPTNHKVFGEAMAILAGDGLLTHAFYSVVQASRKQGVSAERVLRIIEELSLYAGANGMIGGQANDITSEQGMTGLEQLEYIHLRKTSDLITFSLRAGGHIGGADERQLEALSVFGRNIGLAFQIQDDILDVTGDAEKLGKSINSDEKQQKVTYPYLLGLEACREKVRSLTEDGKKAITTANFNDPRRMLEIADYLVGRDH